MELSEKIIVAIIAGSVSLTISAISIITNIIQNKQSEKKLRAEIKNKYTNLLYEKRMSLYPSAFKITSKIKRLSTPLGIIPQEQQIKILKQINLWVENEAGLFLSKEVIDTYYILRKHLGKNPGNGTNYTQTQIDNLWLARNSFRSALRNDISNLHKR